MANMFVYSHRNLIKRKPAFLPQDQFNRESRCSTSTPNKTPTSSRCSTDNSLSRSGLRFDQQSNMINRPSYKVHRTPCEYISLHDEDDDQDLPVSPLHGLRRNSSLYSSRERLFTSRSMTNLLPTPTPAYYREDNIDRNYVYSEQPRSYVRQYQRARQPPSVNPQPPNPPPRHNCARNRNLNNSRQYYDPSRRSPHCGMFRPEEILFAKSSRQRDTPIVAIPQLPSYSDNRYFRARNNHNLKQYASNPDLNMCIPLSDSKNAALTRNSNSEGNYFRRDREPIGIPLSGSMSALNKAGTASEDDSWKARFSDCNHFRHTIEPEERKTPLIFDAATKQKLLEMKYSQRAFNNNANLESDHSDDSHSNSVFLPSSTENLDTTDPLDIENLILASLPAPEKGTQVGASNSLMDRVGLSKMRSFSNEKLSLPSEFGDSTEAEEVLADLDKLLNEGYGRVFEPVAKVQQPSIEASTAPASFDNNEIYEPVLERERDFSAYNAFRTQVNDIFHISPTEMISSSDSSVFDDFNNINRFLNDYQQGSRFSESLVLHQSLEDSTQC